MPRTKRRKKRGEAKIGPLGKNYGIKPTKDVPSKEKMISPNQAGKILDVTGEAVKQWIYNRKLPAVKLANGYWKVKVGDLERFVQNRQHVSRKVLFASASEELSGVFGEMNRIEAHFSSNVADALVQAKEIVPTLFVIDISGGMDGWRLAKRIRSSKHIRSAPIAFISRKELTEKEEDEALRLGLQKVFVLPLGRNAKNELLKLMERIA